MPLFGCGLVIIMAIVGMNFIKISAEKKGPAKGKVSISNNIGIKKVEKADFSLGSSKQEGIRFEYEYVSKYTPDMGNISIIGDILVIEQSETVKQVLDSWKKDKKVPKDLMRLILNNILAKINFQGPCYQQGSWLASSYPTSKG